MSALRAALLALAAFAASGVTAQTAGTGKFREGLKPGLYEQSLVTEMKGMGLPKEQERSTETNQRCVTQKEMDQGFEMRKDCTVKKQEETASGVHVVSHCKDGSVNEFRMSKTAGGYTSEITGEGKSPGGKPFSMSMKVNAKYLGACKG